MEKKGPIKKTIPAVRARLRTAQSLVGSWHAPEKTAWIPVRYNHPLVGTWREVENSVYVTSVVYNIAVVNGNFVVSGIDEENGTKLNISAVKWNGSSLSFTSVYPTTGYCTKHVVEARRPGLVNHWITYTTLEIWRKRPQKRRPRR